MNLTRPRRLLHELGIVDKMLIEGTGYSKQEISYVLTNRRDTPLIQEAILTYALPSVPEAEREGFTLEHLFGEWCYKTRRKKVKVLEDVRTEAEK